MKIVDDLVRDEGLRLKAYADSVGKISIGVGRNLDDNGISKPIAMLLLYEDIEQAESDARKLVPNFEQMPEPIRRGLVNMSFNLGHSRLSSFKKMLAYIRVLEFAAAADEALDSKWARQVGVRAERIADLYRSAAKGD